MRSGLSAGDTGLQKRARQSRQDKMFAHGRLRTALKAIRMARIGVSRLHTRHIDAVSRK
jgi:hypothetical protein